MGRHEEALAAYNAALAIDPQHTNAHSNRDYTIRALRRHEEALTAYNAALAINPRDAVAYHNYGNALYALGRHAEARASFLTGLAIDENTPQNAKANFQEKLGISYEVYKAEKKELHGALSSAVVTLGIFGRSPVDAEVV